MTKTALQLEVERIAKLREDAQVEVDRLTDLMYASTVRIIRRWQEMGAFRPIDGTTPHIDYDIPIDRHPDYENEILCYVICWSEYAGYGNPEIKHEYYIPVSVAEGTDLEIKTWLAGYKAHLWDLENNRAQDIIRERRDRLMKEVEALNCKLGETL